MWHLEYLKNSGSHDLLVNGVKREPNRLLLLFNYRRITDITRNGSG
jgi:hypothetical protein